MQVICLERTLGFLEPLKEEQKNGDALALKRVFPLRTHHRSVPTRPSIHQIL